MLPTLEAELGPGIAEALARTAALARDDADLLDRLAAERFDGKDTLDCEQLTAQPPALRRRIIRLWLIGHGLGDLSLQHIASVEQLVTAVARSAAGRPARRRARAARGAGWARRTCT